MGVDARRALILTGTVVSTVLVLVFFAGAASAQCTDTVFNFTMDSSGGNNTTESQWPGGTATIGTGLCAVTVNRPSGHIDLVGGLSDKWTIASFGFGFSSCILTGGCNTPGGGTCTNCDGVDAPTTCPTFILLPGVPNCTDNRPSCSVGLGGNATGANAHVHCVLTEAPSITKSFDAATIPLNGTSKLTFTISNPNPNATVALTGVGFSDTLPSGLLVATPNGLTGSCGGGTITATAGASTISLSGATLAASASCMFSVKVVGTSAGIQSNSTGPVSSNEGGMGSAFTAAITVVAPPTIAKSFGAAVIPVGGKTAMQFTITNPNATVALTGVGFSDNLPAGLVVATPNGLTGSCGGGTISASAGSNFVSLTGATLAASASCKFSVNVTGILTGVHTNTTSVVTSTNGGTDGPATASVNVVVQPAPVLSDAMLVALLAALGGLGLLRLTRKRRTP